MRKGYSVPRDFSWIKNYKMKISRSKGNQAMKFGQLIQYKMRNVFLEKSW